jgi:hypothetical protein
MSVKDAVIRAAVVKTIKDQVTAEYVRATEALTEHLDPGDRKGVILEDGTNIATVSYSQARPPAGAWTVTDPDALIAWAREHQPDAVREEKVVIAASLAEWFTAAENLQGIVQSSGGEVPDGVGWVESEGSPGSVSVRQTDAQKAAAIAALSRGVIDARSVLELEAQS